MSDGRKGASGIDIAGQLIDVLRSGIAPKDAPARPHSDDEKQDAAAALAAYNELGPDYQDAVVESFLNRVDQQIAQRRANDLVATSKANELARRNTNRPIGLVVVCLAMAIPLTAIAAGTLGYLGLITAWAGIVLVALVLGFSFGGGRR